MTDAGMGGDGDGGKEGRGGRGKDESGGTEKANSIRSHRELRVYQTAFKAAMDIYHLTRAFPTEERFSMTPQMMRCSRSVCANIAEAWRKRRYEAAFVAKLSDSESEACEMQVWLDFATECGYVQQPAAMTLGKTYDKIMAQLVTMINHSDKWVIR